MENSCGMLVTEDMLKDDINGSSLTRDELEILYSNLNLIATNICNSLRFSVRNAEGVDSIGVGEGLIQSDLYAIPFGVCMRHLDKAISQKVTDYNVEIQGLENQPDVHEYAAKLNSFVEDHYETDLKKMSKVMYYLVKTIDLYSLEDELSSQMGYELKCCITLPTQDLLAKTIELNM